MRFNGLRGGLVISGIACAVLAAAPATAKEVVVQMKNKGADGYMVFEPAYVRVNVGDTVRFVPTDKTHNAQSIPGMIPAGAVAFTGKINQPVSFKVTKAGLYGVKCAPHLAMGMVALVQAGAKPAVPAALAAPKLPGLANKRMAALVKKVK